MQLSAMMFAKITTSISGNKVYTNMVDVRLRLLNYMSKFERNHTHIHHFRTILINIRM